VQGEGSVEEVCRGIQYFSRFRWADVLIVARGGGSLEDLWTFNEEAVARAIAACAVPVISAVGHETDVTISDFVADLRAPTPSAAAEIIICTRQELLDQIAGYRQKLTQAARYRLAMGGRRLQQLSADRALSLLHRVIGRHLQRVDEQQYRLRERLRAALEGRHHARRSLDSRLRYYDPRPRLGRDRSRLHRAHNAAVQVVQLELAHRRGDLQSLEAKLSQLSPLTILERGYAIVTNESGAIVKEAAVAPVDSSIQVRLARGRLAARVFESKP
jgi:exodeoxyribonuclease VII large subunit